MALPPPPPPIEIVNLNEEDSDLTVLATGEDSFNLFDIDSLNDC